MKLEKGTTISHYKILSEIGKGGMGEVYLATDTKLNRKVAIKFLSEKVSNDSTRLARFGQEAQTASALNHPNILTIFEIGLSDSLNFMVTEYIDGPTLREVIQTGNLPFEYILDIAIQIASALSAAHDAGIVHRDIKPENVIIRKDKLVKVLDFGIAKLEAVSLQVDPEGETRAQLNTEPGMIMGTVLYMSPEQTRGMQADSRSDIWGLGCVLYEMISGSPPFSGETTADIIAEVVKTNALPLIRRRPETPDYLNEIVLKALEKNPDERYQNVKDLGIDLRRVKKKLEMEEEIDRSHPPADLNDFAANEPASEQLTLTVGAETERHPVSNRQTLSGPQVLSSEMRRHKGWTAVIAIALLVMITGFGYGLYRLLAADPKTGDNHSWAIETKRLTGDGKTRSAEISPDGKFLAYSRLDGDKESLWIKQVETNSNIQVVEAGTFDRFTGVTFSRDGNFVYFDGRNTTNEAPAIYRVPTLGGTPEKFFENGQNLQFSPDGRRISFSRFGFLTTETMVMVANSDGSGERKIASLTGEQFFSTKAVWSPDGNELAVAKGDDSILPNPDESIVLVSVNDGKIRKLGDTKWGAVNDLEWHPSGDSLIIIASEYDRVPGQLWAISYPSASARRLTNNLNGHSGVSITSDGSSIVTMESYARSAIWVSPNLDPNAAKSVMPSTGDTWGFSWTPENRLVYVSDQSGATEVWIMDSDGSGAKQVTRDGVLKLVPVVSPDGRFIVYVSSEGGGQLIRIDIDGGNRVVLGKSIDPDNPDFSRDGKWIIYSAWMNGKQGVFRVLIDGTKVERLTNYVADEPRYSPDGTTFACFVLDEKGQKWNRIAIVPSAGGDPVKYLDVPVETSIRRGPIWTPDGKSITVIVSPGEEQHLYRLPLDGGTPKQLTNFGANGVARRDYSRDGKQIAIVRGEGISNALMIKGFR